MVLHVSCTRYHYIFFNDDDRTQRITRANQLMRWDNLHQMEWVTVSEADRRIPPNAVVGGHYGRTTLYIARSFHEGSITPGYVARDSYECTLPWGGKMHKKHRYEVLCTPGEFVPYDTTDDTTLLHATPAGVSEQGEPLYIGRVSHEGKLINGKIQRSHSVCYIPYKGKELNFKNYEIFVRSPIVPVRR
uniref:Putative farnesoic acid o-methyltransferase-like protein n=1 Tax=Anopheles braziliensis TaxID=58242 RepID=A0A2M3ZJU7_9DIPT